MTSASPKKTKHEDQAVVFVPAADAARAPRTAHVTDVRYVGLTAARWVAVLTLLTVPALLLVRSHLAPLHLGRDDVLDVPVVRSARSHR